jgi:hypothetical protein
VLEEILRPPARHHHAGHNDPDQHPSACVSGRLKGGLPLKRNALHRHERRWRLPAE